MIEIRKIAEGKSGSENYGILIDGSPLADAVVRNYSVGVPDGNREYEILSSTQEATDKLTAFPFSVFSAEGHASLRLKYAPDWNEALDQLWIESTNDEGVELTVMFSRVSRWRKEFSFSDYYRALCRLISESEIPNIYVPRSNETTADEFFKMLPLESFIVIFKDCSPDIPLIGMISDRLNVLRDFHEKAVNELKSNINIDSVVMYFDFPEEVRVPCEQYLVYFAQFLRDLGVQADTAITQDAGQVLFTVTPTDKEQALDNIRTALETYLRLPSNPVNSTATLNSEIAVQRLAGEIQSLQSRLMLARAEIQYKNATIQNQQSFIDKLQLLSGAVVSESVRSVVPRPQEGSDDNVVSVDYKIIEEEENLPKLLNMLRRLFIKEE